MKVRVHTDVDRYTAWLGDAEKRQVPFALARALTMTARDAQVDYRGELPKRFTLRNSWTSRGIRITPATKANPEAVVGSLEPYMARQEDGGTKTPKTAHRVAVPKVKPSRIIPKSKRPRALLGKPGVFEVTTGRYAGAIMQRDGRARTPVTILYWLRRGVNVRPRAGFGATTVKSVGEHFAPNMVEALSSALGHRG
jgi:hypothetical protein